MNNQKFDPKTDFTVRLDMDKILSGGNEKQTMIIAEAVLNICGVIKMWDEPRNGHRIFYTRTLPEDVPQAGVHWIKVELPVMPIGYEMW